MARYDYTIASTYSLEGGVLGRVDYDVGVGSLTQGGSGNVFESERELTNSGDVGPTSSNFVGTVTIGDLTVILTTNGTIYFGWADAADPESFPESIAMASVSSSNFPVCLLAGVHIRTPAGVVTVERLAADDVVLTAEGRAVTVTWVGRQTVVTAFGPPENRWPVLVCAGALGAGLPSADLKLTSDHALLIDGLLIQAGALVNGLSIRRMTAAELGARYVVYHVETEDHDVMVAEGVPVETFVDNVSRHRFDNYAEYAARQGEPGATVAEMPTARIKSARQLPRAVRARLGLCTGVAI